MVTQEGRIIRIENDEVTTYIDLDKETVRHEYKNLPAEEENETITYDDGTLEICFTTESGDPFYMFLIPEGEDPNATPAEEAPSSPHRPTLPYGRRRRGKSAWSQRDTQ